MLVMCSCAEFGWPPAMALVHEMKSKGIHTFECWVVKRFPIPALLSTSIPGIHVAAFALCCRVARLFRSAVVARPLRYDRPATTAALSAKQNLIAGEFWVSRKRWLSVWIPC